MKRRMGFWLKPLLAGLLLASLVLAGCSGDDGKNGTSSGTVTGTVTLAGTTQPVAGATVTTDPATSGTITTDATGKYSATLPIGAYTLTFAAPNFTSQTQAVSVTAGQTVTKNVALVATSNVVVTVNVTGTAAPGASLDAAATVTPLDGSTVQSVAWSQAFEGLVGVTVDFGTPDAASTTVALPALTAYKAELFKAINISPLPDTDDDTGATNEDGTPFEAGIQDRTKVQGINHRQLEEAGLVTLKATVTTSTGVYSGEATVNTTLPYHVNQGIAQVPQGETVLIHGKNQATPGAYDWHLLNPSGADVTSTVLVDATAQNPEFVPTATGTYTLSETTTGLTALPINSATWKGALDVADTLANLDSNGQGRPVGDSNCLGCHNGSIAPDKFTPWALSGHAEIFTQNVNDGGHYSEACFDCHTVGFDKLVANNGVDDQSDYSAMLAGIFTSNGSPIANPLNWMNILTNYPLTAHMTNIQCENCHGPNTLPAHPAGIGNQAEVDEHLRRVSMSAEVCGRCHGEPARHGRYQEWQLSGHANFETAIGEGFSNPTTIRNSCAGCHTAQGALLWFAQLEGGNASRNLTPANVTAMGDPTSKLYVTPDTVQPQTCAVCHDPHDAGTVSSLGNNVNLRVSGDTPLLPGGFKAVGVGKGALCITCHNSRNGEAVSGSGVVALHEDNDATFGTLTAFSAPHEACQGDVLMGRNAYFVQGERSAHSNITDTCTNCHMDQVPAPPELGYPTATNHTFEADLTICAKCHGELDGAALQASVEAELADLTAAIEAKITALKGDGVAVVYTSGRAPTVVPQSGPDAGTVFNISGDTLNSSGVITRLGYLPAPLNLQPGETAIITDAQLDILAKANWNISLVDQDFSKGVHNPSFIHTVLFNTQQQVDAL